MSAAVGGGCVEGSECGAAWEANGTKGDKEDEEDFRVEDADGG